MTNAVKFTGDGGAVRRRAGRRGTERRRSPSTDTGIGVPEADRERIFESFQQGGRGSSREEGTGLGLTLSRRIVELLGGRMWLEQRGRCRQHLRVLAPAERPRRRCGARDGRRRGAADVVVIEDDRPSLDLFDGLPRRGALRVTTARDGQSGLEAVRRVRPAAVLLDIRLPGHRRLGGAARRSRRTRRRADIPVIVVSIVDERARGARAGRRGVPRQAGGPRRPAGPRWPPSGLTRPSAETRRVRGEHGMNRNRILVVEDNPKNLKLVRDVLTYSGYEVIEATTGEDGVGWRARPRPT